MNLLFCAYCGAQISENVSHCSSCGVTTETAYYIDRKENNSSYKKVGETRNKSNNVNFNDILNQYGLFTDFRLIDKGDDNYFDIKQNDIFIKLKNKRNQSVAELNKEFNGQVCISQEFDNFKDDDLYKTISYLLNCLPNKPKDAGLNISGFSLSMFIQVSQKVTAWNMGRKSLCIGSQRAIFSILPASTNFRFTLGENKTNYIQSFCGVDCLMLPQISDWDLSFEQNITDDKIWLISPNEQKLMKVVSDNENLRNVGYGASCCSIYGVINI